MLQRCARNTPAPGLPVKGSSCKCNVFKASAASILCEGSKGRIKKEVSTQFFLLQVNDRVADDDADDGHNNNDADNDDGECGGQDGHHPMRKGRGHDDRTNTTIK